jgi:hypothetical protein
MQPLEQSDDALDQEPPAYAPRRRRRWPGVVLGLGIAVLVLAGAAYWLTAEDRPLLSALRPPPRPPSAHAYAPARPDAGQVARAYGQLKEIYAERGADGVANFARTCAESLKSDPRVLDFCVAFDIFAVSLAGGDADAGAWGAGADARDLALARAALPPAEDPAARVAEIRELALRASLQDLPLGAPAPPQPVSAAQPAPLPPPAPAAARPQSVRAKTPPRSSTKFASAKSAKAKSAATGSASARMASAKSPAEATCLRQAAAARHTVCASAILREADRRLREAYSDALEAGVDPRRLSRDQVLFSGAANAAAPDRDAVETLYNQRTQELEALAEAR